LLEDLGGVAHSTDELKALFSQFARESNRISDIERQQMEFLRRYIENSHGDHWDAAVSLVEKVVDEAYFDRYVAEPFTKRAEVIASGSNR